MFCEQSLSCIVLLGQKCAGESWNLKFNESSAEILTDMWLKPFGPSLKQGEQQQQGNTVKSWRIKAGLKAQTQPV